jgi:hypothetical protein
MRDRDRPRADLRVLLERVEAASPTDAVDVVASQRTNGRSAGRGSAAGGRLLVERSMRAVGVVVLDVLLKHCREVARSSDQEMVEAFAAQGADEAFGDRVRLRRSNRGAELDPDGPAATPRRAARRSSTTTR